MVDAAFVAVETKYTESLNDRAKPERLAGYCEISDELGFLKGSGQTLSQSQPCQFWLNSLIADSLAEARPYDEYALLVLSCADDPHARTAVDGVNEHRKPDAPSLLWGSYEDLLDSVASSDPSVTPWTERFRERYLDLTPIEPYLR